MPSSNKTSIGLNQWLPDDRPKKTDFNLDNYIIDKEIVRIGEVVARTLIAGDPSSIALGSDALKSNSGIGNTAIGNIAMHANTTGQNNTAVGNAALWLSTESAGNSAVGAESLYNATGSWNSVIGYRAAQNLTTGSNNVAIGNQSLKNANASNCVGIGTNTLLNCQNNGNVAVGDSALYFAENPTSSVAVGYQALRNNNCSECVAIGNVAAQGITGAPSEVSRSVFVGPGAARYVKGGTSNIAIGWNALYGTTDSGATGEGNIAIGSNSGSGITTGANNVALGRNSLLSLSSGSFNVAVGFGALNALTASNYCTAVGDSALMGLTTGSGTALGRLAGKYLSNGTTQNATTTNSIFIGDNAKAGTSDGLTNMIVIGNGTAGSASNQITLGNSSITSLRCQVTTITALSDRRIKENIEPANLGMCYESVKKLPVTRYRYRDFTGVHLDSNVTGFLADDVELVFPKAVQKSDQYFPVLNTNGEPIVETVTEQVLDGVDEDGNDIYREVSRQVPKMFLMENVKDITMTEAIPTLWGAMQYAIQKLEDLEGKMA